jgi:cell division protein FtsI/penicillin-binding protein 2
MRSPLTLDLVEGRRTRPLTRVAPASVIRQVQKMMQAVVDYGTGTAAQLPGVRVAGKTGTAELRDTQECDPVEQPPADDPAADPPSVEPCTEGPDPENTDAWFAAYAPAARAKLAIGVMLISAGAGGTTAAPVAKAVLSAALS